MDINALIAQATGGGMDPVGPGGKVPPMPPAMMGGGPDRDAAMMQMVMEMTGQNKNVPMERQAGNEMIDQLMSLIGPAAGGGDIRDGGPRPPGPNGEMAMDDPAFADAYQEWTDENGHEPATDGEFAEVEEWAAMMREEADVSQAAAGEKDEDIKDDGAELLKALMGGR